MGRRGGSILKSVVHLGMRVPSRVPAWIDPFGPPLTTGGLTAVGSQPAIQAHSISLAPVARDFPPPLSLPQVDKMPVPSAQASPATAPISQHGDRSWRSPSVLRTWKATDLASVRLAPCRLKLLARRVCQAFSLQISLAHRPTGSVPPG